MPSQRGAWRNRSDQANHSNSNRHRSFNPRKFQQKRGGSHAATRRATGPSSGSHRSEKKKTIPAPQPDTPALLHPLGLRLAKLPGGLPQPGTLKQAKENWHQISSDAWLRETVRGYRIPFIETPPQCQNRGPPPNAMRSDLRQALDGELETLASSGVTESACGRPAGLRQPTFPKPDGRWRAIFNLSQRQLNMHVQTTHFKMETIHHLKEVVWRGIWT